MRKSLRQLQFLILAALITFGLRIAPVPEADHTVFIPFVATSTTSLSISDISDNRTDFTASEIPTYEKFEITFQSMTGEEDLELKRMIMEESKSVEISDRYLLDKYSFMSVAIGLHSINGKPLGDVSDDEGNFSEEMFWRKFNRVLKLPLHMLASAGVNLFWFEARVRKLFVAEKVGNG